MIDDAVFKIVMFYEKGDYRFEVLDFQDPAVWDMIQEPFGQAIKRETRYGYVVSIIIRVPHGGNIVAGRGATEIEVKQKYRKRRNAVKEAKLSLLNEEITQLEIQQKKALAWKGVLEGRKPE